uniref:Rho termination factor N-terminal domain-containing protein n=1 Tax=viral metagenome TaxID=1070528 RepID=A0A6C0HJI1_9ZZZZ
MFQLVDCFFFISLGITFLLLFLMAFHFKTRISTLEKKNNALAEMCTTIVNKISQVKQMVVEQNSMMHPPSNNILSNIFLRSQPTAAAVSEVIEISDESESGSESDSEDESEDERDNENENEEKREIEKEKVEEIQLQVEEVEEITTEEPIHLETTLPDADLQSEVFSFAINTNDDKNSFKKMSVQMLKTLVISKGLCTDPSKMKKLDLLKMLESEKVDICEK